MLLKWFRKSVIECTRKPPKRFEVSWAIRTSFEKFKTKISIGFSSCDFFQQVNWKWMSFLASKILRFGAKLQKLLIVACKTFSRLFHILAKNFLRSIPQIFFLIEKKTLKLEVHSPRILFDHAGERLTY